jgi:integrase
MEINAGAWSKNTFLRCKSFYPRLLKFCEFYGSRVSLESADKKFLEAFNSFLRREGLNSVSRYSYLNLFKWFLKWCHEEKLLIQDDFKLFSLKEIKRENYRSSPVYLKHDELIRLLKSKPEDKKLQHARDIYCFMSFTGCQLNELQDLHKDDIEDNFIYIRTGNIRKIPLNEHAGAIVKSYSNKYYRGSSYFPPYTKMSLNKYIRQLSVFLKFDRSLTVQRRGRLVESPLYELITINSAKWTFYANMLHFGLPVAVIQKWNGIKNTGFYERIKEDLQKLENESIATINKQYENTL